MDKFFFKKLGLKINNYGISIGLEIFIFGKYIVFYFLVDGEFIGKVSKISCKEYDVLMEIV